MAYSFYYEDVQQPDGSLESRRVRRAIGRISEDGLSERAARREHDRIMQAINQERGSVAPAIKGRTFQNAVEAWRKAIAPNLSPATVRQYECYLRKHILPKFKDAAPSSLDLSALQQFATDLREKLSRKTVLNILGTVFAVLDYAERTGTQVAKVCFSDIQLGAKTDRSRAAFFTREQVARIIRASKEPYKTIFSVAWATGLRAGELLALTTADLDFQRKTICVNKSADDLTREIRQPKTKNSSAVLPMPAWLEATLRNYLARNWKSNTGGLLFPNHNGTNTRLRESVVIYGLRPVLKRLGISHKDVGLHAFRHGLATALVEASVPLSVLQQQMRHADVRTTLGIYAHVLPESQRAAIESIAIGTMVPIGTRNSANSFIQ